MDCHPENASGQVPPRSEVGFEQNASPMIGRLSTERPEVMEGNPSRKHLFRFVLLYLRFFELLLA